MPKKALPASSRLRRNCHKTKRMTLLLKCYIICTMFEIEHLYKFSTNKKLDGNFIECIANDVLHTKCTKKILMTSMT